MKTAAAASAVDALSAFGCRLREAAGDDRAGRPDDQAERRTAGRPDRREPHGERPAAAGANIPAHSRAAADDQAERRVRERSRCRRRRAGHARRPGRSAPNGRRPPARQPGPPGRTGSPHRHRRCSPAGCRAGTSGRQQSGAADDVGRRRAQRAGRPVRDLGSRGGLQRSTDVERPLRGGRDGARDALSAARPCGDTTTRSAGTNGKPRDAAAGVGAQPWTPACGTRGDPQRRGAGGHRQPVAATERDPREDEPERATRGRHDGAVHDARARAIADARRGLPAR